MTISPCVFVIVINIHEFRADSCRGRIQNGETQVRNMVVRQNAEILNVN